MRKLASIQTIAGLKPITGADRIELAQVLGWEVIVKKGEFKVGDDVVYVEIDSLLPDSNPMFEFMRSKNFKVKTMKMRGAISQGIIFPFNILPKQDSKYCVGMDVTNILGIKNFTDEIEIKDPNKKSRSKTMKFLYGHKYTRPLANFIYRNFLKQEGFAWPEFIPKTDEERIQNKTWFLQDIVNNDFYVSEKLDGQSCTIFCVKKGFRKKFGVCSRNINLPKKKCNWWDVAIKYELEKKMKELNFDLYIQGEICGPNIQGNKYKLKELTFFLFNAYDLTNKRFLDINNGMADLLGIMTVPILGNYECNICRTTSVQGLVELSKGNSNLNKDIPREGIVIRLHDKYSKNSAKIINPDFLLKYDL